MAIGTSLGAYFEDDFQHHAGVETIPKAKDGVIKPKDTGDDNALPPDEGSYDQPKIIKANMNDDQVAFNDLPDDAYIANIDKSPGFFLGEQMQEQPWKKYSDRAKDLTKQTYDLYKSGDVDTVEAVQNWESKTLGAGYNKTPEGIRLKKESLEVYGSKVTMTKSALWEAYMKHLQDLAATDSEDESHTPETRKDLEDFSKFDRIGRPQMNMNRLWEQSKFK